MASSASWGNMLMPMLAETYSSVPATLNGARSESWTRAATDSITRSAPSVPSNPGAELPSMSANSSRNSSPPWRATRSVSRVASRRRSATARRSASPAS